ncbi:hypothetical protein [Thalassobacillus hwangdonensis]|uniref:Uncharacterized protein n=1 Tax=Thalassobacillus hwangdonensis TaxID=546108 RepID=A0ABW3KZ02_9BACI
MQSLQDVVYNWLTIKVVADHRPDDTSARDTERMFHGMLRDHDVTDVAIKKDEDRYEVTCSMKEGNRTFRFPTELIELMVNQMKDEPAKFKNYR